WPEVGTLPQGWMIAKIANRAMKKTRKGIMRKRAVPMTKRRMRRKRQAKKIQTEKAMRTKKQCTWQWLNASANNLESRTSQAFFKPSSASKFVWGLHPPKG